MSPSQQLRLWAHELASMARTGLEFSPTPYDTDRYERLARIAEGIASMTVDAEFTPERPYLPDVGYATVKVGAGFAAFDRRGRVALIQRADNGRWALPGGFCEVGSTPVENALRELREESGLDAAVTGLVGVYDNARFASASAYHLYICCVRGDVMGGSPAPSIETLDVRFADPGELPEPMTALQRRMIADAVSGGPQAAFQ